MDWDLHQFGNAIEAGFWVLAGFGVVAATVRRPALRARGLFTAFVLISFGCSDLVEIRTGAWWRPWWLLAWKAACVVALVMLAVDHWRRNRCNRRAASDVT
jgi:hypothetical protein